MGDLENLIGTAQEGALAQEGQPGTSPDQGEQGQPQEQPVEQPEGQPADQQGGQEGKSTEAGDKYKELIVGMGENVVNEMIERYEKVNELLGNPEALKELTKEELVQLYTLRDNLHKNLSEILPALQERSKSQMNAYVQEIEQPEIKEYVSKLIDELDEPEEAEALVKVVKDVIALLGNKQSQSKTTEPMNLNQTLGGGTQAQGVNDIDFEKAMLSPDPKVRAEAIKAFDAQLANWQAMERQGR